MSHLLASPLPPGLFYVPRCMGSADAAARVLDALRDPATIQPCVHHQQGSWKETTTTMTDEAPQWKAVPNPVDGSTGWWSRCHVQFGWEYRYGSDRHQEAFDVLFKPAPAIPGWLLPSKLAAEAACTRLFQRPIVFDQCIINRYVDRQGIRNHIDHKMFGPIIACHTLNIGSRMNFWNPHDQTEYNLDVEHDSLYIMSGDVRTSWFHGMPTQHHHLGTLQQGGGRYSITWRKLTKSTPLQDIVAQPLVVESVSSGVNKPASLFQLTPEQFCRAFFHMDECFEWKQKTLCLATEKPCLRNDVQAIVRVTEEKQDVYVAHYGNQFRGSSATNVHAEEDLVRDARLVMSLDNGRCVTIYLTFQPCHHSAGGRSQVGAHNKSCSRLILEWFCKFLQPRGVRLRIKCCGLYRAHWEEPALFSSRSDAELFGDRTARAQQGIRILTHQPGITVEAMEHKDWEQLQQWTMGSTNISESHWQARYMTDTSIAQFLRKLTP